MNNGRIMESHYERARVICHKSKPLLLRARTRTKLWQTDESTLRLLLPLAKTSNNDTKNRWRKEARERMARRTLSARMREAVGLYASVLGVAHLT
jgi:hypothetical protein